MRVATLLGVATSGCSYGTAQPTADAAPPDAMAVDGGSGVESHPSTALLIRSRRRELRSCTCSSGSGPTSPRSASTFLGPKGFTAVQVSPPSEHAVLTGFPWWQRYQTVGYGLEQSRSGTRAEFASMVAECATAGVDVYVDAIINHMTGQTSGTGSHGTTFQKYEYPGLYTASDFHHPTCTIADSDYQTNAANVQNCELVGLADLNTGDASVRSKIVGYLVDLVGLGVRGFRIDAAKHMAPADLDAILSGVASAVGPAKVPYYFFEVIDYGGEAIHASDYFDVGAAAVGPSMSPSFATAPSAPSSWEPEPRSSLSSRT